MSAIHFEAESRVIFLNLRSSFYAIQITPDGRVLHLGSGRNGADTLPSLERVEGYKIPDTCWDQQSEAYEYPAAGDVSYHECAVRVAFRHPGQPLRAGENFAGTVRDLRPRYDSHEIRKDEEPGLAPKHGRSPAGPKETLCILLKDEVYDFEIRLYYRIHAEFDLMERWTEVTNHTGEPIAVERLDFGCLPLPVNTTALTYFSGAWAREFGATQQTLVQGVFSLEQGGLNTGHGHNPFFLLHGPGRATEEAGVVWFGALAYSGNWSLRFEKLPSGHVRVFGGYGSYDFGLSLEPGESHRTPALIMGCTDGGVGGASRCLHGFARQQILPETKRPMRPVLYNSWEATFFDIDEAGQRELAREAAEMGVELFCVDDGWFGARSSDKAGLGDWLPRREAFPEGLKPLADHVHGLGMLFGLWVEPEMVNPDSDLYRAHPDWVLHYPGRPRTECRNQLILDFGREEVVEHLLERLDALVREIGVDFFKWDMNRYASEPGSVAGRAIWREHVRGLYRIMDELRARHPGLDIQSCSGGGGRIDLGVLARCDQAWASDNTDAVTRTRIQEGFSLAYPLRAMECWVTDETNYLTKRTTSLDLRFDVAMRGVLGIGTPLNALSEEEKARYREYISFYKKIRPTVQYGELYRLENSREQGLSVWLVVAENRRTAVFSSITLEHAVGRMYGPFALRGLEATARYRVSDHRNTEQGIYSGAQLMSLGLPDFSRRAGFGAYARSLTLHLEMIKETI
jgi:alpha-galactosidase